MLGTFHSICHLKLKLFKLNRFIFRNLFNLKLSDLIHVTLVYDDEHILIVHKIHHHRQEYL